MNDKNNLIFINSKFTLFKVDCQRKDERNFEAVQWFLGSPNGRPLARG